MMKAEFENLAGYEVSNADYDNIIEPMYMALPNVSKAEFVKMIDKKRFALKPIKAIIKEMKQAAESLKETCDHYTDWKTEEKLAAIAREYIERKGWTGLAWFQVYNKQTAGHCYYPGEIVFYSCKTYKTFETIKLTA